MGYTGGSTGQVLLTVENGGTLNVPNGYFIRSRGNANTLVQLDGQVNALNLYQDPSDVMHLNFSKTGVMVLSTVTNRQYSDDPVTGDLTSAINTLATDGHITVDGFGPSDPGWGTLYGLNTSYNPTADKTTITAFVVPEPATGALVLIGLGGLMMRRRERETV
jgi:hypothetical protein